MLQLQQAQLEQVAAEVQLTRARAPLDKAGNVQTIENVLTRAHDGRLLLEAIWGGDRLYDWPDPQIIR